MEQLDGPGMAMEQLDDLVPALDLGASVAMVPRQNALSQWIESSGDVQRFEVAAEMLTDFDAIDVVTGWPRTAMATLLGCRHPDPEAWLHVDIGELMHSQTVVRLIRDLAEAATRSDTGPRVSSLRKFAPSLTPDDAKLLAGRDAARSAVHLCKDLLRRARGSNLAVRRVLEDGAILGFVGHDQPGAAQLLGFERLAPHSQVVAQVEARMGQIAFLATDPHAPVAESLAEVSAAIRAGLNQTAR